MRPSSQMRDIASELAVWKPERPAARTWFASEFCALVGATFAGVYRPTATESGWTLEYMHAGGRTPELHVDAFRRYVKTFPSSNHFLSYKPYSVDAEDRNRPLRLCDFAPPIVKQHHAPTLRAAGAPGHDQLRVLLCDGPRLLSWVGATRAEPFTPREVSMLRYFVGPLHRRLRLEEHVSATWPAVRALEVALDALPRAALVLGPTNTVEIVNRHARVLLERDGRAVVESIRRSQRRPSEGAFEVTPLTLAGHPPYVLAIAKPRPPILTNVIAVAQAEWRLTMRQTRVLELMGSGASNREIAQRLACAEVTVENHITGLYRRSGTRSRAELFVRMFTLGKR